VRRLGSTPGRSSSHAPPIAWRGCQAPGLIAGTRGELGVLRYAYTLTHTLGEPTPAPSPSTWGASARLTAKIALVSGKAATSASLLSVDNCISPSADLHVRTDFVLPGQPQNAPGDRLRCVGRSSKRAAMGPGLFAAGLDAGQSSAPAVALGIPGAAHFICPLALETVLRCDWSAAASGKATPWSSSNTHQLLS